MPAPAGFRIGTSDRTIGDPTSAPDGFFVYNITNGNGFECQSGVWQSATFPADVLQAFYGTANGLVYRIGTSDRALGESTSAPDGLVVLNLTNGQTFIAQGGVWTAGGAFPSDVRAAWLAS